MRTRGSVTINKLLGDLARLFTCSKVTNILNVFCIVQKNLGYFPTPTTEEEGDYISREHFLYKLILHKHVKGHFLK